MSDWILPAGTYVVYNTLTHQFVSGHFGDFPRAEQINWARWEGGMPPSYMTLASARAYLTSIPKLPADKGGFDMGVAVALSGRDAVAAAKDSQP